MTSGLIPAGAGQMTVEGLAGEVDGAHPRGCGADGVTISQKRLEEGSSPRVRGRFRGIRAHNLC